MEFPILHDPGSIEMLLRTVAGNEPPRVVDHDYLVGLGFKREVDEGLLKLLSFLGFIDENGQPTPLWKNYGEKEDPPRLLRQAVRASYGALFSRNPQAHNEEGSVLMDFFREESSASDPDAAYMILTFKVLCDLAGFDEAEDEVPEKPKEPEPEMPETKKEEEKADKTAKDVPAGGPAPSPQRREGPAETEGGPILRISINLDLDEKADPELRELAMKLLRKQLEL
ncbi:MAG: hypothetical protein GF388_07510 [Candidatus Aegiribacteria sp.]|nr:hypothetical protein [Candidatus Aegiribacteria sp.]MBD3294971.1 hypothetical protein [Candidatus Fermentibacteria bacterium]